MLHKGGQYLCSFQLNKLISGGSQPGLRKLSSMCSLLFIFKVCYSSHIVSIKIYIFMFSSLYFDSSCFLIEIFILGSLMGLLLVLKKQIELRISAYILPNIEVK